jgi:hypothetical protein
MARGEMVYRFSKDAYVYPAGDDQFLVVEGEAFRDIKQEIGEETISSPAFWFARVGAPGVVIESGTTFWNRMLRPDPTDER